MASAAAPGRDLWRYWPLTLVLFGLLCPLLLSTWYTFHLHRQSLERSFELELEQMANLLATGMREPIWNLTPELGQPLVESLMRDPRVRGVHVTSDVQGPFLQSGATSAGGEASRVLERPVTRGPDSIGRVRLVVDAGSIDEALSAQWLRMAALGAIQAVLAVAVVLLVYRILQRRERDRALRELNERLRQEVAQRAEELEAAHRELVRRESLAVLGRRTATVSHELRNPLGTITTSLSTIESCVADGDPRIERAIARAERNIQRCTRLIDELLGFTQESALEREATDVDRWLAALVEDLEIPRSVALRTQLQANRVLMLDRERGCGAH